MAVVVYVGNMFAHLNIEGEVEEGSIYYLYPEDKRRARIKRMEISRVTTLKDACLQNIIRNLDNLWCKDYINNWREENVAFTIGPFDDIPGVLLTELQNKMENLGVLHKKYIVPLITCRSECLNLKNIKNVNKILHTMQYKCKALLRELHLSGSTFAKPLLNDTLSILTNLTIVDLSSTLIDDNTLGVLGSNNKVLRVLSVNNTDVTDTGITYLCVDDGHFGKCKDLVELSLTKTNVKSSGLLVAIHNLPKLVTIRHENLAGAIVMLQGMSPDRVYLGTDIEIDLSFLDAINIKDIIHTCPNLKNVSILNDNVQVDQSKLDHILNLRTLHKISLTACWLPDAWFIYNGANLTNIVINVPELIDNVKIDLTIIGQTCPSLEIFESNNAFIFASPVIRTDSKNFFTKIKSFSVTDLNTFDGFHISDSLNCIFKSEYLEFVYLSCTVLPSDFFHGICVSNKENQKILSNLKHLTLYLCKGVKADQINYLICHAPRLKYLNIIRCCEFFMVDTEMVTKFNNENNFGIQLQVE